MNVKETLKWLTAAAILAAIAFPNLIDQQQRSAFAAIRPDLDKLHIHQLAHQREHGTYSSSLEELNFTNGSTVHILITGADAEYYQAEGYQNKYFEGYLAITIPSCPASSIALRTRAK